MADMDRLKENYKTVTQLADSLNDLYFNNNEVEGNVDDLRQSLVGACNLLQDLIEDLGKIYYEGRTLHPWYAKELRDASLIFKSAINVLKEVREDKEAVAASLLANTPIPDPSIKGKGKETKKPTILKEAFGAKLVASERPVENKISWADMVQEELEASARLDIEQSKQSLTAAIRSRISKDADSRIEIPGNLKDALPTLYRRMVIAARLAKCELVENGKIAVKLARPDVFGTDEKARNDVLDSLYDEKGVPKKELLEIADLSVLIDTLLEIPDATALELTGPGRIGIHHTVNLLMRVYSEQRYSTPMAQQRHWWKGGQLLRNEMQSRLANQVDGPLPANCILNAFDVLYRKFIRQVLANKDKSKIQLLEKIAADFSERLLNSGAALFNSLLREETRKKKVEVDVLQGKKTIKKVEEVRYRARIRPSIAEGPKTPFESAIYAKVNKALSKVETLAVNYSFRSKEYASPNEWEENHRSWVENLYSRVKIPSTIMVGRKQAIRAAVLATDRNKPEGNTGSIPTGKPNGRRITPAEWTALQDGYVTDNEENFNDTSVKAINDFLGTTLNKEGLLKLSEADILSRLDF
jgi:hypothetical protein